MTLKNIQDKLKQNLQGQYTYSELNNVVQMLSMHILQKSKIDLLLMKEEVLTTVQIQEFESHLVELQNNRPIQYILQDAPFLDLDLYVDENVLIPRPETEELVLWIESTLQENPISTTPKIVDIGTGSGCIPLGLKSLLPTAEVYGTDISEKALAVAQKNATKLNLDVQFFQHDILAQNSVPFGPFDVIVSNPPYIPFAEKDKMAPNVLDHEPHLALFVKDEHPLIFYQKIAEWARIQLKDGGYLFFELNEYNAEKMFDKLTHLVNDKLTYLGNDKLTELNNDKLAHLDKKPIFTNIEIKKDMQGKDRMLRCRLNSRGM